MAHADLVEGINQADIAKRYNRTKGSVSQASKIVWLGFLKSKGYEEVRLVLGRVHAFVANGWHQDALHELNYGIKRPERKVRRRRRAAQKTEQESGELGRVRQWRDLGVLLTPQSQNAGKLGCVLL